MVLNFLTPEGLLKEVNEIRYFNIDFKQMDYPSQEDEVSFEREKEIVKKLRMIRSINLMASHDHSQMAKFNNPVDVPISKEEFLIYAEVYNKIKK